MRQIGVDNVDAARTEIAGLKDSRNSIEATAQSLKQATARISELEETGGLADMVTPIFTGWAEGLDQMLNGLDIIITNLTHDTDAAEKNISNADNRVLGSMLG